MKTDRRNRMRHCVVSVIGFSLATLVFGCQSKPKDARTQDALRDRQALRSGYGGKLT
jgi:hypothetical protein